MFCFLNRESLNNFQAVFASRFPVLDNLSFRSLRFFHGLQLMNISFSNCRLQTSIEAINGLQHLQINQIHRILQDFTCKYTIARQLCYLQIFCINARMTILIGFHPD